MRLVRVKMLGEEGELHRGNLYNVPEDVAEELIVAGKAIEVNPIGPTEFKPIVPSEIKLESPPKKKPRRVPMASESS